MLTVAQHYLPTLHHTNTNTASHRLSITTQTLSPSSVAPNSRKPFRRRPLIKEKGTAAALRSQPRKFSPEQSHSSRDHPFPRPLSEQRKRILEIRWKVGTPVGLKRTPSPLWRLVGEKRGGSAAGARKDPGVRPFPVPLNGGHVPRRVGRLNVGQTSVLQRTESMEHGDCIVFGLPSRTGVAFMLSSPRFSLEHVGCEAPRRTVDNYAARCIEWPGRDDRGSTGMASFRLTTHNCAFVHGGHPVERSTWSSSADGSIAKARL